MPEGHPIKAGRERPTRGTEIHLATISNSRSTQPSIFSIALFEAFQMSIGREVAAIGAFVGKLNLEGNNRSR
jgi:hypothetical protein